MNVFQILPELNSGGVERGTVEFGRELVRRGHASTVVSAGGRQVARLEAEGSEHIQLPVHRKSLLSLQWVRPLRRLLVERKPDIVHVRSRVPAWLAWLAWRNMPAQARPHLVSTFHGMYSVNAYSAVMARGERIIAISAAVRDYIIENYPGADPETIRLIHRGVDAAEFCHGFMPSPQWREAFFQANPGLVNKRLLLMPGRLSRWKGQLDFIALMAELRRRGIVDIHGLVVGSSDGAKQQYERELRTAVQAGGLQDSVSFLGHRNDMKELYAIADIVYNLSNRPEPFGRTVTEALSIGTPVIAYDRGGPAEVLRDCFPPGLADPATLATVTMDVLSQAPAIALKQHYLLSTQVAKTIATYEELL
ncbi:glycosyltransferase family 4 protein [Exilibacterium tricleocarpae]|uniref:Glycosyltransferase family 4 protein n=1 Tax=Exilibacterium tricleocarpae TaxID=2591008 RepID=A0A545TKA1_9GAMM|nr:glycosyltransferase family 4 protein [Exilibacterium tricleocarpae]TQV77645.1 glycosyltransferase family 4 protein [Exilibacterium tricleocarpae]